MLQENEFSQLLLMAEVLVVGWATYVSIMQPPSKSIHSTRDAKGFTHTVSALVKQTTLL
jgi:hypothetical protein